MTRVRPATPTVAFIDQYCAPYRALFHNVRHFEQFTALHLGLLAETRRKSLPRLGTTVHADPQALHHFLARPSGRCRQCAPSGSPCFARPWPRPPSSSASLRRGTARKTTP